MRVALFFDGKNFYEGLRDSAPDVGIDFARFSRWAVHAAGGPDGEFTGAYYYTGHSSDPAVGDVTRAQALSDFLDYLATVEGFFVRREPRVRRVTICRSCHAPTEYTTEKRVDTRLVAEMIHYAAVDAYDVALLASGDDDFVPAVDAVDRLGKRVVIGAWPRQPVARDLRAHAFGQIDLGGSLAEASRARTDRTERAAGLTVPTTDTVEPAASDGIIRELRNAEAQLAYVSRWYFVNRWRGEGLPASVEGRERIIDELVASDRVEQYELVDAKGRPTKALRLRADANAGTSA